MIERTPSRAPRLGAAPSAAENEQGDEPIDDVLDEIYLAGAEFDRLPK